MIVSGIGRFFRTATSLEVPFTAAILDFFFFFFRAVSLDCGSALADEGGFSASCPVSVVNFLFLEEFIFDVGGMPLLVDLDEKMSSISEVFFLAMREKWR